MAELKGNLIIRIMRRTINAYEFNTKRKHIIKLLKEADIIENPDNVKKYVDFCYYNQEKEPGHGRGTQYSIDRHHIIPKCIIKNKNIDTSKIYEGANNARLSKPNHIIAHKMLLEISKDEYKEYFKSFENM